MNMSVASDPVQNGRHCDRLNSTPHAADFLAGVAGVIGHDLNNALAVISNYCELMVDKMPASDPQLTCADRIQRACQKAATLANILGALSFPQPTAMATFDFERQLSDLVPILASIIGKQRKLMYSGDSTAKTVHLPQGLVLQMILGLFSAARQIVGCSHSVELLTGTTHGFAAEKPCRHVVWMSLVLCGCSHEADGQQCHSRSVEFFEERTSFIRDAIEAYGGSMVVRRRNDSAVIATVFLPGG